ncbi:MAG: hypothetical protein RLZZ139_1614 [Cyanobacteriota bacterium]
MSLSQNLVETIHELFLRDFIAIATCIRTNQNPKDEWRREAPPRIFWVLCPKQNLHCYSFAALTKIAYCLNRRILSDDYFQMFSQKGVSTGVGRLEIFILRRISAIFHPVKFARVWASFSKRGRSDR